VRVLLTTLAILVTLFVGSAESWYVNLPETHRVDKVVGRFDGNNVLQISGGLSPSGGLTISSLLSGSGNNKIVVINSSGKFAQTANDWETYLSSAGGGITDGGAVVYVTSASDDFAVGGTTPGDSDLYADVSENMILAKNLSVLQNLTVDGGTFQVSANNNRVIVNGDVILTGNLSPSGAGNGIWGTLYDITLDDRSKTNVEGTLQIANLLGYSGHKKLSPTTYKETAGDVYIQGDLSVSNNITAFGVSVTSLSVRGTNGVLPITGDVNISNQLTTDGLLGTMWVPLGYNANLSMDGNFVISEPFPFDIRCKRAYMSGDYDLASSMTLSLFVDAVEKTSTAATRPFIHGTDHSSAIINFTDFRVTALTSELQARVNYNLQADNSQSGILWVEIDKLS